MNPITGKPALYAPADFVAPDPAAIVRQYPFALLVTTGAAGIYATSTPMFFETDAATDTVIGHLSRRNPHAPALAAGQDVLAVFAGPHAYVSSSWYAARPSVPTWNYVIAHVRGKIEPIDEPTHELDILRRTTELLERDNPQPWTLEQAPPGRVDFLLPLIRSFRIRVASIEGVTKLNQTHPPADRMRIIRRLLQRGDADSVAIAQLMAEIQPTE